MSISTIIANGHGGFYFDSTEEEQKALDLPDGVQVAFYEPPGRSLDARAAKTIHDNILSNKLGVRDSIAKLKEYQTSLSSVMRIKQTQMEREKLPAGVDPTAGVREFRFGQGWPRVVQGSEDYATFLYNYKLSGPKPKELEYARKKNLFFGYKEIAPQGDVAETKLDNYESKITLKELLELAEAQAKNSGSCVLHWLACRAHFDSGAIVGDLFEEPVAEMVTIEKVCLQQGARKGIG